MPQPLMPLVLEVAGVLRQSQQRIVFAESCTGGLVSAALARVPGISEFLCGSAVVYRLDTKTNWLGVPEAMLREVGPVSEPVARAMVLGVLAHTPEADLAASITGHLGPDAPIDQDGLVYIAVAHRDSAASEGAVVQVFEHRLPLDLTASDHFPGETPRERRQWHAVELVLSAVLSKLVGRHFTRIILAPAEGPEATL